MYSILYIASAETHQRWRLWIPSTQTESTMPCKGVGSVLLIASQSNARSEPQTRIMTGNPLMKLNQTTPQHRWGILRRKTKFMRKHPQRINVEWSSQQAGFPVYILLTQNKTVPNWQQVWGLCFCWLSKSTDADRENIKICNFQISHSIKKMFMSICIRLTSRLVLFTNAETVSLSTQIYYIYSNGYY